MGHPSRLALFLAILFIVVVMLPVVAAQAPPVEDRARDSTLTQGEGRTPAGEEIARIWVQVIWVSAAIFLLVTILLVYALVRWRHRRGEKREVPQIHGNSKLEIAWTIGPALIMVWLLVISYNGLFAIDDPPEVNPDVSIDVIGHSFFWEYVYPDGTSSTGGDSILRLEAGQWVQLNVTSADVHHAFKIPGLDVMIDAMPGRVNEVYMYTGEEPGVYLVQCLRFCGAGHGAMMSTVVIFAQGEQPLPYGAAPRAEADTDAVDPVQDGNETVNGNETAEDNVTADAPEVDREIEIDMFEYFFDPAPVEVDEGETVLLRVTNSGTVPHDVHIGSYDFEGNRGEAFCPDPDDPETCWATSPSMPPGEVDTFVLTAPDEAVAFDFWCAVPGHVQQGMITYLSVAGAVPEIDAPEPRLPGPGIVVLLLALGSLLFVLRRRDSGQE